MGAVVDQGYNSFLFEKYIGQKGLFVLHAKFMNTDMF